MLIGRKVQKFYLYLLHGKFNDMKKTLLILAFLAMALCAAAQTKNYVYTEASDLTLVGKLMPGKTSNPYHRVDTSIYKGFTPRENQMVRMSSGMGCVFRTDSRSINVKAEFAYSDDVINTNGYSGRGFDLYIREDGSWRWAGSGGNSLKNVSHSITIVDDMDGSMHECLLYFPLYSEESSIKVGVEKGSTLEPLDNPFRSRIAIWGSSYTHGSSTSRAGMAYPSIFSRRTGLQMLSLGCSGRCLLQDYFCDVLCDVEADAFVFDTFSNPGAEGIQKKLIPFIDRMIAAHPGVPMIFQQTIYREKRYFNKKHEEKEQAKMDVAARIFKELKSTPEGRLKYKDVYFIIPDACSDSHEATVDGVHPDNYGYLLWEQSIEKPILRILRKYGIR